MTQPESIRDLYRSLRLRATAHERGARDVCVVTFDHYSETRDLDRRAFAERFLRELALDAVHVVSDENDWYQYEEMADALAAIAAHTRSYRRVVTYGSSMGGFAAIRYGASVGAEVAVAISPQFSVNPRIVPFERRWSADAARIRFLHDEPGAELAAYVRRAVVFYDPRGDDRRHVELLRAHTEVVSVALSYAGHPASLFLREAGLLPIALTDVVNQRFDCRGFLEEVRARRGRSSTYFRQLSKATRNAPRALRLAQRAVELAPHDPESLSRLGVLLADAGLHELANSAHVAALILAPAAPALVQAYARMLDAAGEADAARRLFDRWLLSARAPEREKERFAQLRARMGGGSPRPVGTHVAPTAALLPQELRRTTLASGPRLLVEAPRPTDVLLVADDAGAAAVSEWLPKADVVRLDIGSGETQVALQALVSSPWAPRSCVVALGSVNLIAGDTPVATAAGILAVVERVHRTWPLAAVATVELPAAAPGESQRVNELLRAQPLLSTLAAGSELAHVLAENVRRTSEVQRSQ